MTIHPNVMRSAFKPADLAVVVWDLRSRQMQSLGLQRLYALPDSAEPTHETLLDLIHPDDRLAVQIKLRDALTLHQNFMIEFRVINPHGYVSWLRSTGKICPTQSLMIETIQNISPVLEFSDALVQNELRWQAISNELNMISPQNLERDMRSDLSLLASIRLASRPYVFYLCYGKR
jgi:hypothetical protein